MAIIRLALAVLLGVGLFKLLGQLLRPYSRQAAHSIELMTGSSGSLQERIIIPIAQKIKPLIRLAPYAKQDLADNLVLSGVEQTPELYVAANIVSSGFILIFGSLFLLVNKWIGLLLCVYAVYHYFKRKTGLSKWAKEKWEEQYAELPRYVSYCIRAIKSHKDPYAITKNYRANAGPEFGKVLDRLLLNMRITNPETALQEFAASLKMPLVTDFAAAMAATARGEDMSANLSNIERRFQELEKTALQSKGEEWYAPLTLPKNLCIIAMVAVFMTAFGIYIYNLFTTL